MSTEGDTAPMEEDEVPPCHDSPSASSTSMDWVKVDDTAGTLEPSTKNCDEYSFGSSDEDDNGEDEGGLEMMADVSLVDTPFDMEILQSSIEGSEDALDLVAGKDVVMVVGKTGVGKSTLIQGIAGKKIQASFHKASFSGQTSTKTVFDAQDALPNFEIGHAKASKTRSLNAFLRKNGGNEVVYLDSPGLEDTRGAEMDIATSALLSQVAKRSNNLRFVVLIHCASLFEDRGNAFRAVVQFAHKFVSDFAVSRTSFMFLFTHTNEIAGMESASDARKRIQQEIVQIAGATKDEDVLAVLDYLRKSLKKGYPFADILKPLETDYQTLASTIEKALSGVCPRSSARSCNLTLSPKLKLERAVNDLLDRLQVALGSSSPSTVSQVKDIQTTFHYLQDYVDVDFVHRTACQCEEYIDGHKRDLKRCIDNEFARWKNPSSDFDTGNARALHDSLTRLEAFDVDFSAGHWLQCKADDVSKLQDTILLKASSNKVFRRDIKKLRIWTEEFEVYTGNYPDTCKQLRTLFEDAVKYLSKTDLTTLHNKSCSDIDAFVENVLVLKGMVDFCEQASLPEINFEEAAATREKISQDLSCVFRSWTTKASELAESDTVTFKHDLEDIALHARFLQSMKAALNRRGTGINSLDKLILAALTSLESDMVGLFTLHCEELMSLSFEPSWEPKLLWMRNTCQRFSAMQGVRWTTMGPSFSAVIGSIKSSLHTLSGELETMSQVTKEHGMRSGQRLGQELVQFQSCKWFDSYLPEGDAFVANCCIAIERAFSTRIEEKSIELANAVSSLDKEGYGSTGSIEQLRLLLPELREIDNFLGAVRASLDTNHPTTILDLPQDLVDFGHAPLLAPQCVHHLEEYTRNLCEDARERTGDLFADINKKNFDKLSSSARILELMYADADALNDFQFIEDVARRSKKIMSGINKGCKKLSSLADFSSFVGDFKLKANVLAVIKSCSDLPHIRKQLPDYRDIQHQARNLVALEAKRLEQEIESGSDWDMIDEQIEAFKAALVLDQFVSQEVSARLNTIQRLREKKEGQVDEHLQDMIRTNNFVGIAQFLTPLANSRDQIKKAKFESYQAELVFNLEMMINDTKRCLDRESMTEEETVRKVAQNMAVLADAKASLQRLLQRKLNLGSQIGNLKTKIDNKLGPLVDQISRSIAKKDFVRATLSHLQASFFTQHLETLLRAQSKRRFRDASEKYKRALKNVTTYVDAFFQSEFKDTDDLIRSLTSLQQATDIDDASMKPLALLYDETKGALLTRIREFLTTVQDSVSQAQCFDDVMPLLRSLNRQISGPFKSHVPTDLLMECDNLLGRLHKEKQAYDRQFEFGGEELDLESLLDRWARELDKLQSPAWHRKLFWKANADRASYNNMKRRILFRVDEKFKEAKTSLRSCDYRSVQESIEFLSLVEKNLRKHVDNIGPRLHKLSERCVNSFVALCAQIKTMVEAKEISRVEEKFAEYRGFVIHIPCILASKEGKREFTLVNQILCESFAHQIDSFLGLADAEAFDFPSFRVQVLRLRALGDFFADRMVLLHEEVKHTVMDKWLDAILGLCSKHFSNGRDFGKLRQCIELGVVPSASQQEIRKAFKAKAKLCHPDKIRNHSSDDAGSMFRKIKEAQDELLASDHFKTRGNPQAFDDVLKGIDGKLRTLSKEFMGEQRYDMVEKLLFQLPALKELDSLVTPKLKSREVQNSVYDIIKGHVEKMRIEVDSNWSSRKYKELHESIADLKQMESHFKPYPQVFAASWNTGIVKQIESEIDSLGKKAKACLSSHSAAKQKEADFRRFFIEMGSVLVELPSFKAFTKRVMSNVLETCLESSWGYGFLFEFGQGIKDSSDADEKRVAHTILGEFSHFKEVLTMCWNEEVSKKPVEDVVPHIRGEQRSTAMNTEPINIDQRELIESFKAYEKQYKSFLAEYIKPDADLNALVQKVTRVAEHLHPVRCDKTWTQKEKKSIPMLLAGIFSLFTVIKSGASYNRIEATSDSSDLGEKLLMKPHNIQVLTLLLLFGCGKGDGSSLDSQLMQIRTGEGKSMILGAAAVMFAILGFRVRTVCYSEYLSARDFQLFEEVFQRFNVLEDVKYSKITTFAEDSTAMKGNLRDLTESLLRGNLLPAGSIDSDSIAIDSKRGRSASPGTASKKKKQRTMPALKDGSETAETALEAAKSQKSSSKEEILLVDEVDVFFGREFYGQTYNQVLEFKEPEVATILTRIWNAHSKGGHRLRLRDIQAMPEYKTLLKKLASFAFLLDNEISLMLAQVKRVDDIPYFLDSENDRIGYKVMDSISYNVTFGYSTIFAYLKEAGNLKHRASTLSRALVMPVSCGQFSYANISPSRIMGVSGTLEAIGQYEKDVLNSYGLNKFIYVPSVYGESNFSFDKAGEGIHFESSKSNFYHKLSVEIKNATKAKRAVIVFFRDRSKLDEFVKSATFRQLGRHKSLLTEDMSSAEKEHAISAAARAGQITLSTAVFGRGTDFFCADDVVEKSGGVHIIQTFLSEQVSEEIQIQGRTARQGKKGSFQMILLDSDLDSDFGVSAAERDKVPRNEWYNWLCSARLKHHKEQCLQIEENIEDATEKDQMTHQYFDSLLAHNEAKSKEQFEHLYQLIKKPPTPSSVSIDLALLIDVTGSMAPYAQSAVSTIQSMICGQNALTAKLAENFPEIEFELRLGCLGFRDIDDGGHQFTELKYSDGSHFSVNASNALSFVKTICASPSGGFDLAEDIVGAIHYCANWQDWASDIRFMMLLSDAAAHGLSPKSPNRINNADSYSARHPNGLTAQHAVTGMVEKDADLFFLSFNPSATARTEDELSKQFGAHPNNAAEHGLTRIPMVPQDAIVSASSGVAGGRHIIFVLDESGSMRHSWSGVVAAYNQYISKRKQSQSDSDLVSVVQFDSNSRVTVQQQPLSAVPGSLSYSGGGTAFHPAAVCACKLARATPASHTPAVIFMSDGQAGDASHAAQEFSALNNHVYKTWRSHLELHVVAFGSGTNQAQLQQIASASGVGKVHASSNTAELAGVFVEIASNQNVSLLLESEIAKRITEAVSDKLSLEYFGS